MSGSSGRRTWKVLLSLVAVVVVGAQFVRPERTNPPVESSERIQAALAVPAEVADILQRSCMDCHSHETRWPWYSNIVPVGQWLVEHVQHGRDHVNLSRWAKYDAETQRELLEEMCEEVEEGHMPLPSYLRVHRDARLSPDEVELFCQWAEVARRPASGR